MGRVAVVTGGASGMGLAICRQLAEQGDHVALLDIHGAAVAEAAEGFCANGATAIGVAVDVSERSEVDEALDRVRSELGPIEILVTSAAVSGFAPFEDLTVEDWERTMRVNVSGTFHCIQLTLPDMVEARWGRIVTISSAAGQTGALRQGHYAASKGAVIALTKSVALEYASRGITANTVPPFIVDTPMLRGAQEAGYLPKSEVLARMTPAGRLGTGADIGATCAFLCSDAAGYITGQVIGVNGGAVT